MLHYLLTFLGPWTMRAGEYWGPASVVGVAAEGTSVAGAVVVSTTGIVVCIVVGIVVGIVAGSRVVASIVVVAIVVNVVVGFRVGGFVTKIYV